MGLTVERKEYEKKNKMNLKNAYLQDDIIKSQETEKYLLKQTLETQKSVYEDYGHLTSFDIVNNMGNFPAYAQLLTKTLSDQAEKIKQMRQYSVEEKKVEKNMGDILTEIQNLNFPIATQTSKWDLLSQYQNMVSLQDSNLKDLGPALTYVVQNHKRYNYNLNEDGVLLGMELCQCLPETGDSGIQITDIEFICPNGTVFATSLEAELSLACTNGNCPDVVDLDQCGDFDALPWSDWEECKGDMCLANSTRQRKIRLNGSISYEYETNGSQPLIMNKTNIFDIYLPEGAKLAVFVMGGGGGADDGESGSSGFFQYEEVLIPDGKVYSINVTIGQGGDWGSGTNTNVDIAGLNLPVVGRGGGYSGGQGWSGGSSEKGGWNGSNGNSMSNGSGEKLPTICDPSVKLEAGQTGDYDSDGTGGGGVIVNGKSPHHRFRRDGYGYGAGGGEDNYDGYDGVAVLVLCL